MDLFCGEGGGGMGYHRAGFDVFGVDLNDDRAETRHRPRPRPLQAAPVRVDRGGRAAGDRELRRAAMEIDWMTGEGLNEAIPPRYTEFVGRQLLAHVQTADGEVAA